MLFTSLGLSFFLTAVGAWLFQTAVGQPPPAGLVIAGWFLGGIVVALYTKLPLERRRLRQLATACGGEAPESSPPASVWPTLPYALPFAAATLLATAGHGWRLALASSIGAGLIGGLVGYDCRRRDARMRRQVQEEHERSEAGRTAALPAVCLRPPPERLRLPTIALSHRVVISRSGLEHALSHAGMIRMAGFIPTAAVLWLLLAALLMSVVGEAGALLAVAGTFTATPILLTYWVCQRGVICPICGGSLWNLRVPHFKPGRIEVEADVTRCPHCRTGIVPRDSSPRILTPCSGRPPE